MPDVFISYAGADRKRGEALADALASAGYGVVRGLEAASADESRAQVAASAAVIACWSRAGTKSDPVIAAAAQAYNQGKLIAVRLQAAEAPYPYDLIPALDLGERGVGGRDEVLRAVSALVGDARQSPPRVDAAPAVARPRPKPANMFEPKPPPAPAGDVAPEDHAARNRIAIVAVAAIALFVGGLWAVPRVIGAFSHDDARARRQADEIAAAAKESVRPISNQPSVAPAVAEEAAAPPASSPVPEISTPVVAPAASKGAVSGASSKPAAAGPASAEETARNESAAIMAGLEKCMGALVKQCPKLDPALAPGFAADARISPAERRLLNAPLFPDGSVTGENLAICRDAVRSKASAALSRACPAVEAKPAAPAPKPAPATSAAPATDGAISTTRVAAPPL